MKPEKKSRPTPTFPTRAVITNGMPYGDKRLHFGHVGGCFIHSDIYARFLRNRIGQDNVLYVSGTDCYGAGSLVKHKQATAKGFTGDLQDFVSSNHHAQKSTLDKYNISLDLYAASSLAPAASHHSQMSADLFNIWYDQGYLRLDETDQFYDEETDTYLNGRQVEGKCPISGCQSEKGYADECSLGHQYAPKELIDPIAITTGRKPVLRKSQNWYFDLERFKEALTTRHSLLKERGISRRFLLSYLQDFLKDPAILISKVDDMDNLHQALAKMPPHHADIKEEKKSATITFKILTDREQSCEILRDHGIRFRTGTTLTPFRLTGNVPWGIPVPEKQGVTGQTFWVWSESLWAPLSFVKTALALAGSEKTWQDWFFSPESQVYQFIGEDNIYFYDIAGMGLFMALQQHAGQTDLQQNLPVIVPNRHVFFGNAKASSSGKLVPPSADALLDYYTPDQLRIHFGHMALQNNSVKFLPKAYFKKIYGDEPPEGIETEGFDITLAEGNLLTNVYNRLARTAFYTMQDHFEGKLPADLAPDEATQQACQKQIDDYEFAMYKFEYSKAIDGLDKFLRDTNKQFDASLRKAKENATAPCPQALHNAFHAVKIACVLLNPFAPEGTAILADYLSQPDLFAWENINTPMDNATTFKHLAPKVDFFTKHPSQLRA